MVALTKPQTLFGSLFSDTIKSDILLVVLGSVFLSLMSQVSFPLSFTPIPITGQTLAVLLISSTLGRKRGVLSILLYLTYGLVGLPVFAGGGFGPARIFGPTGGYLIGFLACAYVLGFLSERGWGKSVNSALFLYVFGTILIVSCGAIGLSFFVGWDKVLPLGVIPFIPGGLVKIFLASALLPLAWKLVPKS